MAGQSVGMVTKVQPCQEIIDELILQAETFINGRNGKPIQAKTCHA
jgi:hypothetical protein